MLFQKCFALPVFMSWSEDRGWPETDLTIIGVDPKHSWSKQTKTQGELNTNPSRRKVTKSSAMCLFTTFHSSESINASNVSNTSFTVWPELTAGSRGFILVLNRHTQMWDIRVCDNDHTRVLRYTCISIHVYTFCRTSAMLHNVSSHISKTAKIL